MNMTDAAFFLMGVLLGGLVAWWLGTRRGADRVQGQVRRLLTDLRGAGLEQTGGTNLREASGVSELRSFLLKEWVPREEVRDRTIDAALNRMGAYLRHRVEGPLLDGLSAEGSGLREGVGAALDAVEDLEFFLDAPRPPAELGTWDLREVVQEVAREFGDQSSVLVKIVSPPEPLRVRVDPEALKDALFLILHNAGEFGRGNPVQVILGRGTGEAQLRVRDRGPGFSAEGLMEAMNPFYSTSPTGLGLGLPHARKTVEALGGELLLRNLEGGGAEVEIDLPLAE